MTIDFDLRRLRDDVLAMFINASLADRSLFGRIVAASLVDEELRRSKARTADEAGRCCRLQLPDDIDLDERYRINRELANSSIELRLSEHHARTAGELECADAVREARAFLGAIGLALDARGSVAEQFLESVTAGAVSH